MSKFNAKTFQASDRHIYASQFASVHLDNGGLNFVPTVVAIDLRTPKSLCTRSFAEEFGLCTTRPRGRAIRDGIKAIAGFAKVWIAFVGMENDGLLHRGPRAKVVLTVTEDSNLQGAAEAELDDHVIVLGTDFINEHYQCMPGDGRFHLELLSGKCQPAKTR